METAGYNNKPFQIRCSGNTERIRSRESLFAPSAWRTDLLQMKLSGNTVLITGGSSGIGNEFAAQLLKRGNTIIITGRDQSRLEQAQRSLPGIHVFQSDISDSKAIFFLFNVVIEKFPALNVLINNAGIMRKINLLDQVSGVEDISR